VRNPHIWVNWMFGLKRLYYIISVVSYSDVGVYLLQGWGSDVKCSWLLGSKCKGILWCFWEEFSPLVWRMEYMRPNSFIVADCVIVSRISNSDWEYTDIVRLPNVRQLSLLVMRSGINGWSKLTSWQVKIFSAFYGISMPTTAFRTSRHLAVS